MRKMKDSGIEWIGEIPESWDVGKLGYFIQVFNGDRSSNYPSGNDLQEEGIPFLTSSNLEKDELTLDECKYITQEKYDSMGGFKMQINDIIYCLRGSVGKCSINLTEEQGTVASSLMGIRCTKIDPKFLLYILKSSVVDTQNALFINGTCAANLSAENVLEYRIPILDTQTQVDIVDYLDKKCAEIDAIIAAKEKTNELLKERRQSIIYEAVTKGLDHTVPMKDSGIEWIGEIPESWDTCKLKYAVECRTEKTVDKSASVAYIGLEHVKSDFGVLVDEYEHIWDFEGDTIDFKLGDVLFGKLRPYLAKAWPSSFNGKCSSEFWVMTPIKLTSKFLLYTVLSNHFISNIDHSTFGVKMPRAEWEYAGNQLICCPSIAEQENITEYLDLKCSEIDSLISENAESIEMLKEYRQSVIYEAVTGKVEI